jgi:hypothetical protein
VVVQLLMRFLETTQPTGATPVWPTLEQPKKDEIVAMLARLIAKATGQIVVDDEETHDD